VGKEKRPQRKTLVLFVWFFFVTWWGSVGSETQKKRSSKGKKKRDPGKEGRTTVQKKHNCGRSTAHAAVKRAATKQDSLLSSETKIEKIEAVKYSKKKEVRNNSISSQTSNLFSKTL
jgi:hypothetical protein